MLQVRNKGLSACAERLLVCVGAIATVAGATTFANAQVIEWDAFKGVDYQQTLNNVQPTVPTTFIADSFILVTDPADIDAAEITSVAGTHPYDDFGTEWDQSSNFGSLAALNLAFPENTTYTMNITSGTLAPSSQSFFVGPDAIPTGVPYLTGNSFDALRMLDPANPIELTWESAASAGVSNAALSIYWLPSGGGEVHVFDMIFGPNDTGFVLPGGTLIAGETYEVELVFANLTPVAADAGGFNAPGFIAMGNNTIMQITAGGGAVSPSCLGDASNDGVVNFNDITSVLSNWLGVCP